MLTTFLIDGGYVSVLGWHLAALAGVSAWSLLGCVRGLGRAALATLLGLILFGILGAGQMEARPSVYYDEFFYVAIARNMATSGRAEPLLFEGLPPRVHQVGHFQPPYPQGWPYLLSLTLGPASPPRPGLFEASSWEQALLASRVLWAALPPLFFLAARRRFSLPVAAASAVALPMLPFVLRLSGSVGAEIAALFFMVLSWLALECFRGKPCSWNLGWLVLSGTALAEMRPEGLLYVPCLLGLAAGGMRSLERWVWVAWLLLGGLLLVPPGLVMGWHDPTLAHHFQVVPRGGFSLWGNRLANLLNNGSYFLLNRIWPVSLTLLALVGLSPISSSPQRRVALLAAGWIGAITLFLSWLPFGDYGAVNSLDTWRFGHHVALPGVLAAAVGAEALARRGGVGRALAGLAFVWVMLAPWTHRGFLQQPHPLLRQDELVATLRSELGDGIVVAEAPEYFCYLRYRHGLPVTLAPVAGVPPGGVVLFAVDEGAGLPDLEAWKAYDLEPLALDQEIRPPAGLFRLHARPEESRKVESRRLEAGR